MDSKCTNIDVPAVTLRGPCSRQLFAPLCEHCGGEFSKYRTGTPDRLRCAGIIVCNRCRQYHRYRGHFPVKEDA